MSFEPVSIACATCGSQLRVTNPALLGTIAPCPKCRSLVEIPAEGGEESARESARPPVDHREARVGGEEAIRRRLALGDERVDSEAITQDGLERPDSFAPPAQTGGFAEPPEWPTASETAGEPVRPATDWQRPQTERTRNIVLVTAIGSCGLVITALLFSWFVYSRGGPARTATARPESTDAASARESRPVSEPRQGAISEPDEPVFGDGASADGPGRHNPPGEPRADATGPPAERDGGPERHGRPGRDSDRPADGLRGSPSADDLRSADDSPSGDRSSAADGSPSSDRRVTPAIPETSGGRAADPPELGELSEGMRRFTPFLDLQPNPISEGARLPAPASAERIELDEATEEVVDPMLESTPREPVNFDRALALEMGFASADFPFADLMLVISQLTGVPIEIDWGSFDLVGENPRQPVNVSQSMERADAQLGRAATAAGAEIMRSESMLIVTPTGDRFSSALDRLLDLDDLGDGRGSAEVTLRALLGEPEAGRSVARGETRTEQQLAALAAESLRRMRGLAGKIPEATFRKWCGPITGLPEWPLLDGGENIGQPDAAITLSQILREVARRNGASCVIHWGDGLRRQMSPIDRVIPYTGGDAGTMLRELLDPLGLQVRRASDEYWWVGTEATYDRMPLAVWSEPVATNGEKWQKRMQGVVGAAGPQTVRYAHDSESDRLLVLAPRFIARQLAEVLED